MVTGWGTINGRRGLRLLQGLHGVRRLAVGRPRQEDRQGAWTRRCKVGAPIIGLFDAGGARIQEGVESLAGYADIFLQNVLASGVIPQISVIMGPCAGGDVYSPAITDFIFMVKDTSYMYVTGPDVVKTVTNEDVSHEDLGGYRVHAQKSGVADGAFDNDLEALTQVRRLVDFLPLSNREKPPVRESFDDPDRDESRRSTPWCPANPNKPYDMKELILKIVDEADFFEISPDWAQEHHRAASAAWTARPWASSPTSRRCWPGVLDIDARAQGARASCASATPSTSRIVTFVDVPGFMPGTKQEHGGLIKHGAKLLFAFAEATVPKITADHPQGLRRRL